jgi:pimeloyl-ACP methyl ester carboxylesterase
MLEKFWYRFLGRPYTLNKRFDEGQGVPVVLLHGIGRSGEAWRPLESRLHGGPYRVIAFDLLGFGASPKPDWLEYDIDTHARHVIAAIKRAKCKQPVVLVGHSLGALVALRVGRLRPDLVRHLMLYEMPLYDGLPEKRRYRARLAFYFTFYQWVIKQKPTFGEAKKRFYERVGSKLAGLDLTPENWQPFVRTLENSIMKQTAASDIRNLKMAADVIYGSRDMLVIRGKVKTIFGEDAGHITAHTIRENHSITPQAADFLAGRLHDHITKSNI